MADKKLTIGLKSDLTQGKGLIKFLDELASSGNKVAQSLKNITLDDKTGRGGLSKALLEQKKLFEGLGDTSKKLAGILKKEVSEATDALGKKIDATTKRIDTATKAYEKWSKVARDAKAAGLDSNTIANAEAMAARAKMGIFTGATTRSQQQQAMSALSPDKPTMGGQFKEFFGSKLGGFAGTAGAFGLMMASLHGVSQIGEMLAQKAGQQALTAIAPTQIYASQQQAFGRKFGNASAFTAGLNDQYWRERTFGNKRANAELEAYAEKKREEEDFRTDTFSVWMRHKKFWDPAEREAARREIAMKAESTENAYHTARAEFIEKKQQADPVAMAAISSVEADALPTVMLGRRLGSMRSAAMGKAQAARWVMPEDTVNSTKTGLVSAGGRSAQRLLGQSITAQLLGMDTGTATSLAGKGMVGGDLLGELRKTILTDPTVLGAIGQGVVGQMGPERQFGSMSGLTRMLASGSDFTNNTAIQRRVIAQNTMGLQGLDQLSSGTNAWQKSVNLSNAVSNLGPGASIYSQQKLSRLPLSTILGILNAGTEEQQKAAIPGSWGSEVGNLDVLRKQATKTISSTIGAQWRDQGGTDTQSILARRIKEQYQGDWRQWAKDRRNKAKTKEDLRAAEGDFQLLGGLLSNIDRDTYGDDLQATGMVRASAGLKGVNLPSARGGRKTAREEDQYDKLAVSAEAAAKIGLEKAAATLEKAADKQLRVNEVLLETLHNNRVQFGAAAPVPATVPFSIGSRENDSAWRELIKNNKATAGKQ